MWGQDTAGVIFAIQDSADTSVWSIPIQGSMDPTYRAVVPATINGKTETCYYELWWPGSLGDQYWRPYGSEPYYSLTLYNTDRAHILVRWSNDTHGYSTWIWVVAKVSTHEFYITEGD